MGWSIGYDSDWRRDIGYGVPSICDHPKCNAPIDRGLGFVCGGEPYGGEKGCGLFFCDAHGGGGLCLRCRTYRSPYKPKPDVARWILHKLTDESWSRWRSESSSEAAELAVKLVKQIGPKRYGLLVQLRDGTAAKDWEAWAEDVAEELST